MNKITLIGLTLATLLTACGDKNTSDDSASTLADDTASGGGDGGGDGASDGGGDSDPEAPTISQADSWCYEHTTGDKAYFWVVEAEVDDPQGSDTIESFMPESVTVLSGDTELAHYALVCADGACTGSWNQAEDSIACSNATSYTIRIVVIDEDDNESAPYEVTGRIGTDASGR